MGEMRGVYSVLAGKTEGKRSLGDPAVDGRIISRWIFTK
jgi:predicted double-glycine peptidase